MLRSGSKASSALGVRTGFTPCERVKLTVIAACTISPPRLPHFKGSWPQAARESFWVSVSPPSPLPSQEHLPQAEVQPRESGVWSPLLPLAHNVGGKGSWELSGCPDWAGGRCLGFHYNMPSSHDSGISSFQGRGADPTCSQLFEFKSILMDCPGYPSRQPLSRLCPQ